MPDQDVAHALRVLAARLKADAWNHSEVLAVAEELVAHADSIEGSTPAPTITALVPSDVALGSPSFTVHVMGTFQDGDVIVWNGSDEVTTFVSATELTTGVNMDTAEAAVSVPVLVRSGSGAASNEMAFTFKPASPA